MAPQCHQARSKLLLQGQSHRNPHGVTCHLFLPSPSRPPPVWKTLLHGRLLSFFPPSRPAEISSSAAVTLGAPPAPSAAGARGSSDGSEEFLQLGRVLPRGEGTTLPFAGGTLSSPPGLPSQMGAINWWLSDWSFLLLFGPGRL